MNKISALLRSPFGPFIFMGVTLALFGGMMALAVYIQPPTPTQSPVEATMAVVRETVIAEITAQAATQAACPPPAVVTDPETGRSLIPAWRRWNGRYQTVSSQGASFFFQMNGETISALPLGNDSGTFDRIDRTDEGVTIYTLINPQGEYAGKVLVYLCPMGGQYLSEVIYP